MTRLELDPLEPIKTTETKTVYLMTCDTPGCRSVEHDEVNTPTGTSIECRGCGARRAIRPAADLPETPCP